MRARIAIFALCVPILAACVHAAGNGRLHPWTVPGELRYTEPGDVDNLNQILTAEALVTDLSTLTQGFFFTFDPRGELVPSLAVRVPAQRDGSISADGKTITYKLRHGVVWQDGVPFTSEDVAFSVRTILDPRVNTANTLGFDQIAALRTPDAYTVVVTLKRPYARFIPLFMTPHTGSVVLPKHLLEGKDINHADYNALPVGLGPFRYVQWSRGSEIRMVAFDRWWGGKPKLRSIVFRIVPDVHTALNELRTHELDMVARYPGEQYPVAVSVPYTRTLSVTQSAYWNIAFNLRRPVLQDRRVREALVRAVDERVIRDKVNHGSGVLSCTPFSHTSWAYDNRARCYAFDTEASRRLLEQAGWHAAPGQTRVNGGTPLRLTLVAQAGNAANDATAVLVQSWFRQAGVDLQYRKYQGNQLYERFTGILDAGKFDLALYSQGMLPADPDISSYFSCARVAPKGYNAYGYCSNEVDRLLTHALTHYGRGIRRTDYVRVQQLLSNDIPAVFLGQPMLHMTINDNFRGVSPGGYLIFTNPAAISNT